MPEPGVWGTLPSIEVDPCSSTTAHSGTRWSSVSMDLFPRVVDTNRKLAAAACVISMECSEEGKDTWGRDKSSNTLSVEAVVFSSF